MGQHIVLLHFLNLEVLREHLLDESRDDEVAVQLVAKAKQVGHQINQLVVKRHLF